MTKIIKKKIRQTLSIILVITILLSSVNLGVFEVGAEENDTYTTLYLIDNTAEKWIGNDNATIELVDNSSGHDSYMMTKVDDTTWSVCVPESAYNITFNRYSPDKSTQWNSWSAGGRDSNNAYFADGSEYGHWELIEVGATTEENYFHAGDIIYLDVSEFTSWENDNAVMYVNFSGVSKEENSGLDINLLNIDNTQYNPHVVETKVAQYIYAYVVSREDEGATELRFWRGNASTLWNCSIILDYNQYKEGNNCVKVLDWNDQGSCYAGNYEFDYVKDTDEDGLSDYLEKVFNCDINNIDTDGDKLTDNEEVCFTRSNPAVYDSLIEEVSDGDVDIDEDGLSNYDEVKLGTLCRDKDSDNDGAYDGVEVNEICSDPLKTDTDGDTLADGDEIKLGFSALLIDTDSDGIIDCDEKIFQETSLEIGGNEILDVSVSFEGTGYIESTTSIKNIYNQSTFVSDTVGLIGEPIEITSTSCFDTATICFYINGSSISSEELSDLLIMWYDEENDAFVAQETSVDIANMTISANVTHFSKYLIVDKNVWFEAWRKELSYDKNECVYNTVIAIDCSGSMSWNDPNFQYTLRDTLYPGSSYDITTCYRKLAAQNYINAQSTEDKTAIVLFESDAMISCSLTGSKSTAVLALDDIYSSGGTNYEKAIEKAIEALDSVEDNSEKMILFLSDGESSLSASSLNEALANDIVINTVYIGSATDNSLLQNMAEQTNGEYFKAVTSEELMDIYSEISIEQKIDSTDTDQDGLLDTFEITGMRLSNGQVIVTDPYNSDTDGDGLLDGDEIKRLPVFKINTIFDALEMPIEIQNYIFTMESNPTKKDSDYDKISDLEDPLKMKRGISNEMSSDYKEELYAEIDAQIEKDFNFVMQHKNAGYYSTKECLDIIYEYDGLITELSNKYLLPKAAIQTVLLRELCCYDIRDDIADGFVMNQYSYLYLVELYYDSDLLYQLLVGYPDVPIPYIEDSSVGYGQIFAKTAIKAYNWAVEKDIVYGTVINYDNWKERKEVWINLKDDNSYNISMIALVLIHSAYDEGLHDAYWKYTEGELKTMLSRYNGFGDEAIEYGNDTYNCYKIFEKYNRMDIK